MKKDKLAHKIKNYGQLQISLYFYFFKRVPIFATIVHVQVMSDGEKMVVYMKLTSSQSQHAI